MEKPKRKINKSNTSEKIKINENIIIDIGKLADELGYKVYIVGGYVRDYSLERPREDFDFTVIGDSIAFAKKLAASFQNQTSCIS